MYPPRRCHCAWAWRMSRAVVSVRWRSLCRCLCPQRKPERRLRQCLLSSRIRTRRLGFFLTRPFGVARDHTLTFDHLDVGIDRRIVDVVELARWPVDFDPI